MFPQYSSSSVPTIAFVPLTSVRAFPWTHWAGEEKGVTTVVIRWLLSLTLYEWTTLRNSLFLPPNMTCFNFLWKSLSALTDHYGSCFLWPLIDTDLVWNADPILSRSIYSGNFRARRPQWYTFIEKCSSSFPNRSSDHGKLYIMLMLSV